MTARSSVGVAYRAAALGKRVCSAGLGWLAWIWIAAGCSPVQPEYELTSWKLSTVPADGDRGVDRQARITLEVNHRLLPSSVTRTAVSLHSGGAMPWVDLQLQPVLRQVWITWRGMLDPETTYAFSVSGLVDLDGVNQPEPYRAFFRTGTQIGGVPPAPKVDPPQVVTLFQSRCASAGCHDREHAASGLDLSSAEGIESTARNQTSQMFAPSDRPAPRGSLFTAAPLIIDANAKQGDPARSYIIYKLLGDDHILGAIMPPPGEEPLQDSEIQMIADWIRAGAATRS